MKRLAVLNLILITLLLNIPAASASTQYAVKDGDFSIRNGIHFGMSKSDVIESEKEYGTSVDYKEDAPAHDFNPTGYQNRLMYKSITLMGYPNSNLYMYFDSNDKLMSIGYAFGITSDYPPSYETVYTDVKELLIEKYGNAYITNSFLSEELVGSMFGDDLYSYTVFRAFSNKPAFYKMDQWVVEYDNCYVIIDLYSWTMGSTAHTYLGYRGISPTEFDSLMDEITTEKEIKESKRQNDI